MEKAIIKFNGGSLAILCTKCRTILKSGKEITPEEMDMVFDPKATLPAQYCEKCKPSKKES